jgi:hypothetical protein
MHTSRYIRWSLSIAMLLGGFTIAGAAIQGNPRYIDTDSNYRLLQQQDARSNDIERHLDSDDTRINDMNSKVAVLEGVGRHIDSADQRINDLNSKVSVMEGAGGTIVAVLVVLNLLGFLTPKFAANQND